MDINNIRFPASAIANLYPHSLVDTNSEPDVIKANPEPGYLQTTDIPDKWKSLGENKKNILIVVDHRGSVHLPDDDLDFLTNLLTACNLSLTDVAIVNRNNFKETYYKDLISNFKSRIIFLFGTDPVSFGLPVSFPHFQIQSFANATFLFAPGLDETKTDKLLKSKLWVCLRRLFAI